MFDQEMKEIKEMDERLKSKVDGVIDMDLHGNMKVTPQKPSQA